MAGVVENRKPRVAQRLMVRMLMQHATVISAEPIAGGFHHIGLEGASLRGATWRPGDKIQVNQGGFFTARAYTPLYWDSSAGTCELLIRTIGQGPGAEWASSVRPGEPCDFFPLNPGMQRSSAGRTVLFGDETSIATAIALTQARDGELHAVIECTDDVACGKLLARYQVRYQVIPSSNEAASIDSVATLLADTTCPSDKIILTGSALTVQVLYRMLRPLRIASEVVAKPYWAPGKTGLS